jgi:Xaa-Pro aminopeptidase
MYALTGLGLSCLQTRRLRLQAQLDGRQALVFSGGYLGRNYAGNPFAFRASSHFLYFVGVGLPNACFLSSPTGDILFLEPQSAGDILWHGQKPTLEELSVKLGLMVKPLSSLSEWSVNDALTIPGVNAETRGVQTHLLGRCIEQRISGADLGLAAAIVEQRMIHDEYSLTAMKETIQIASQAHAFVPSYLKPGMRAREVWSRMQAHFTARGYGVAYNPIITTRGEVLHGGVDEAPMKAGELLLLDVGCEHSNGSASDISRTWAVSGSLSSTQSLIHQAVKAAQSAAVERCQVGQEFTSVHMSAMRSLTHSLLELGIFKGSLDALMEREVGAYFFPHGVGHLLGLDVHDMEDLGDLAGYANGRERSSRRSLQYLRMDRKLERNMIVTIEPGFYQVPQLIEQARRNCFEMIDWHILDQFGDVRGVRLEDDVLVEKVSPIVLSTLAQDIG